MRQHHEPPIAGVGVIAEYCGTRPRFGFRQTIKILLSNKMLVVAVVLSEWFWPFLVFFGGTGRGRILLFVLGGQLRTISISERSDCLLR